MTPRLLPSEPFPPYAFVPGRSPHPISDPAGHSYGQETHETNPPTASDWRRSRMYLRGVDLFNFGYYWEAHESWEAVWIALGRRGVEADFVKALIKLAAAGVKAREGRAAGVQRHARRALELLGPHADTERFFGLRLATLRELADRLVSAPERYLDDRDELVNVMPAILEPA